MDDRNHDQNAADPVTIAGHHLSEAVAQTRYALKDLHRRDSATAIVMALDTSQQKFQSWRKQWVDRHDHKVKLELLWGEQGWNEVKLFLAAIKEQAQKIELANSDCSKQRSSSRSRLKRALTNMPKRESVTTISKRAVLLKLAMDLSGSIDQLWIYSDVAFDSLHGLPSRTLGSPSKDKRNFLTDVIKARSASLALYRACANSGLDCNLGIDLLESRNNSQAMRAGREFSLLKAPSKLSYHIYTQTRDVQAELRELLLDHQTKGIAESEISVEFDSYTVDLRSFESNLKSDFVCIQPQREGTPSYFRVSKPSTIIKGDLTDEPLVRILKEGQFANARNIRRSAPFNPVELAFKLAECGLYLLGTPWLASLSSQRVRRLGLGQHRHPFVLEIRTLDIEDLAFEDPEALTETTQLFKIGFLLMEIALNKNGHSNASWGQGPYMEIAKRLPLVEQSMGSEYCKATAFCLQHRRPVSHFGKPDKYRGNGEKGWTAYLAGLLGDYHSQVYQRLVPQNKFAGY